MINSFKYGTDLGTLTSAQLVRVSFDKQNWITIFQANSSGGETGGEGENPGGGEITLLPRQVSIPYADGTVYEYENYCYLEINYEHLGEAPQVSYETSGSELDYIDFHDNNGTTVIEAEIQAIEGNETDIIITYDWSNAQDGYEQMYEVVRLHLTYVE